MLIRTVKGVVHTMAGVIAGAAIVLLALAWLLSRGPISLGFLAPYVSDLINEALPTVEAEFDDTILTWAGWERAVDMRVINLRVKAEEGSVLAQVPEVAFSVSTKALMRGVIAPSRVELFGPTLYAVRETDGHLNLALAGAGVMATGKLEPFLMQMSAASDPDDPLSYLTQIDITDADLVIEDIGRGRSWVTPDTQVSLRRDGGRIDAETSFLVDLDGNVAEVSLVGAYDAVTRRIDAGISFTGVTLSALANASPELAFLNSIDVPVQGTVTIASSVDGVLESVGFDVSGEAGVLRLPPPLEQNLPTENLTLRGHFDAAAKFVEIAEFQAELAPDATITVPSPVDHEFPLAALSLSGAYDGMSDSLNVQSLDLDLAGVSVMATGDASSVAVSPRINLDVGIPELATSQINTYWPASMGTDIYDWVMEHIVDGVATNFAATLELSTLENGEYQLSDATGGFDISSAVVRYVESLPPVEGLDGVARFTRDTFELDVSQAHSSGMDLDAGSILFYDLTTNIELAKIRATVSGPFRKAMEFIDGEPLNFTEALAIDPTDSDGTMKADLAFDFPIKKDLEWDDVKASADAALQNVSVPKGLFGLDVEGGQLDLTMDNDGMSVAGELLLHNFPTILTWRQNFDDRTTFRNRYEISSHVTDVQSITDLGIDVFPFSADLIKGEVPVNVHVIETHDGHITLEGRASLDGALMSLPAINWRKRPGSFGEASVSIEMQGNMVTAIPAFSVQTDDFVVEGAAHYSEITHRLNRIELGRIEYGRTNMSGLLVPGTGDSWDANFVGESLDLDPVWEDIVHGDFTESGESLLADISLSAQFERVWLEEDRGLDNLVAAFAREDEIWKTIYITSQVTGGAPLEVKLTQSEQSEGRILTVWSSDAGETLRTLDLYDLMMGGELALTGKLDDTRDDHLFTGTMEVGHFRIVDAPALTKLVSLMSLTGIVESLQGEGLVFDRLDLPVEYADGVLRLSDAKVTGASLGFTASGVVYTHADMVDVSGTVVPAYALNSVLGNIPLIGNIFTGGEEGSGIFAANYSMTGSRSDPEVSVNPLSVLAPGFLRNIFGIFEGAEGVDAPVATDNSYKD